VGCIETPTEGLGGVPAYPQPPITNIVKMKTAIANSRCGNPSENSAVLTRALGCALDFDASRRDPLRLKIFMAAYDKRTRCAKATQMQPSQNYRDHQRVDAPNHRQSPQPMIVNGSRDARG
jgi:hypothetical protein